ncbi:nucleotidyltransferase family protein [Streptomyces sp. DSM 44915]|uniref:Nucleotidyltransferase family protein n=1 Tax=Streptomyces chisholmiae TaxID=3075540 RepID=A0ABU2JWQ5_9ACTN|nr:nucleotidyltransferase family protein [Streptomyces sp. DSM 44915]MDT0268658.1 nucleotidyltransferase family protein [Streptomyces sp. DSM 44915]
MGSRALDAVLWAGGFDADPAALAEADPGDVITALDIHRVAGRFLGRLADQPTTRVDAGLLQAVRASHARDTATAARLDADASWVAQGVKDHPAWDGRPLVLLKGNCASHLLGDPHARRHTSDLDVLTGDGARYGGIFEGLGYTRLANRACHEDATFAAADRSPLDLHGYFPVWRYPAAPHTVAHGGGLAMADWPTTRRLTYETVLTDSVPHPGSPSGTLRIPDVTTATLLLCAHVFKDYVEPPFIQPLAKVRLAELCEIRDLARHPKFDAARFTELATEHAAQDAVGFVRQLLTDLDALPPTLNLTQWPTRDGYPQEAAFGVLVDAGSGLPDLLVRSDTLGTAAEAVGHTVVPVGRAPVSVAVDPAHGAAGAPALWSTPPAHPKEVFTLDCQVAEVDDGISLVFHSPRGLGVYLDELLLCFGNELVHTARDVYQAGFREFPWATPAGATWEIDAAGWHVSFLVPRAVLDRHRDAEGRVPLLVCGTRFVEMPDSEWDDFFRRCVSSVLVPLILAPADTDQG